MTSGPEEELLAAFREAVAANPLLADLAPAYLADIVEVRPTFAADDLRVIARAHRPLVANQVLPLWNAWRQTLRSWTESGGEARAAAAAAGGSPSSAPAPRVTPPAPRPLSVVPSPSAAPAAGPRRPGLRRRSP